MSSSDYVYKTHQVYSSQQVVRISTFSTCCPLHCLVLLILKTGILVTAMLFLQRCRLQWFNNFGGVCTVRLSMQTDVGTVLLHWLALPWWKDNNLTRFRSIPLLFLHKHLPRLCILENWTKAYDVLCNYLTYCFMQCHILPCKTAMLDAGLCNREKPYIARFPQILHSLKRQNETH